MNVEDALEIIDKTEHEISLQVYKNHAIQIHLTHGGIALVLNGIDIAGNITIDLRTIEQFVLRRYLTGIPFRANWVLRSLVAGYPSTSFALLRVLFEELVSMNYFIQNPDAARSAFNDENYIEPGLTKKLNAITSVTDYQVIAKRLSDGYVHPRLNRGSILDTSTGILPEPFYNPKVCNLCLDLLVFIVDRSAAHMTMFGVDEAENREWLNNLRLFSDDVREYQDNKQHDYPE